MDVINWLFVQPDDSGLKRAADELESPIHIRRVLKSLVRAILTAYPWRGRSDLVPVFDPSRRYERGQFVALPVRDPQGLRPDTWRIAGVTNVDEAENPVQGEFQIVTLDVDGHERLFAAGVDGAQSLPLSFSSADEQAMEWLVADLADAYAGPLTAVLRRACDEGRLPLRIVGDQVLPQVPQPTLGDEETCVIREAFAAAADRAVRYLATGDILEALREHGYWGDAPDDLARATLTEQLPQRGYHSVGGDRWVSADDLESARREVSRKPKVPVIRSRLLQEKGLDDSADFDDYDKVGLEDSEAVAALEELGESGIEKPPAGPWRPPTAPIAVGALTYQHIVQGFLPIGKFARAFPHEPDPLLVDVTLVEGDPIPCWVSQGEGMLKAADAEQWRRHFLDKGIPAGTKVWLEHKGGISYRIAPRPLARPERVPCKLAWVEEGKLGVAVQEIEIRYESDPNVFKAELRFEDLEALFREAEECGYSIFDIMYQEFPKLAALHPEGKVHQRDLFNVVFLRRMCSPRSVVTELYLHPCFVPVGRGWFKLDETRGYQRLRPAASGHKRRKPAETRVPAATCCEASAVPEQQAEAVPVPGEPVPETVSAVHAAPEEPPPAPAPAQAEAVPEVVTPEPVAALPAAAPALAIVVEAQAPAEPVLAPESVVAEEQAPAEPEPAAGVALAETLPEPVLEPATPAAEPPPKPEDIWCWATSLLGRELHAPRTGQPFRVVQVTNDLLHIVVLPGEDARQLRRAEVEAAWQHLAEHGSITKGEIRQFCTEDDVCYLGAVLAALAGGRLVVRRDCSLTPAPPEGASAPPAERPLRDPLVTSGVVQAGPLFESAAEGKHAQLTAPEEPDLQRREAAPTPARAPSPRAARPSSEKRSEMQAKTLFSRHHLETRLPQMPEWTEDPRPVFEKVRALWQKARQRGDSWNEAQTEDEFVKPVLELLGWAYIVQAKSLKAGKTSRPDYALFRDAAAKDAAYPYQGQDDAFYSRALAIAEAKYWERPLSQKESEDRETWKQGNPSHQMVSYLVGTRAPWGILTNGRVWRLYSREVSSTASEFYEVDLGAIFDALLPDAEPDAGVLDAFRRWWLFFRRDAFVPDSQGKSFVQRVHEGSATYARQVSDKLKDLVFRQVVPEIAGGFIAYRYHQRGICQETDETLKEIYAATLSLLYKLLFLLYAEARDLLPVNDPGYRDQSLTALAEWAADALDKGKPLSTATHATPKYDALLALFRRIDQGDSALGIPRYNGGLFSPNSPENRFLADHKLSDQVVARAIDTLRRDAGQPVDYAYISVRNLGAIYEGLLENKLRVVDASRGQVELVNDKGERKATGSYYTPDYIVEYIVQHTLDPILDERDAAFRAAMDRIAELREKLKRAADPSVNSLLREQLAQAETEAREAFLGIRVLDPAMGSGHFLVNAVDHLTDGIIQRMQAYHSERGDTVPWEWNPIQKLIDQVRQDIVDEMDKQGISVDAKRLDDTAILTRIVMKRCIYGVDLNPLAVELAKLSLWLHSFTVGAPLSFLDHHLRWGNSLIGTDVRTVQREIKAKPTGEGEQLTLFGGPFAGLLDLAGMMVEVAERADATLADIRQSADTFEAFQRALTPYKQVLDLWVSRHFGNKAAEEFLTLYGDEVLPALKGEKQVAPQYQEAIVKAKELWREKRFFHWDLEFPEAFVDLRKRDWAENPGFDAVIGNPPWGGQIAPVESYYYRCVYHATTQGGLDTYKIFTERALMLWNRRAYVGVILPNTFLTQVTYLDLRLLVMERAYLYRLVNLGDGVFDDVAAPSCILCLSSKWTDSFAYLNLKRFDRKEKGAHISDPHSVASAETYRKLPDCTFIVEEEAVTNLLIRLLGSFPGLGKVDDYQVRDVGINYNCSSVSKKVFYIGSQQDPRDFPRIKGDDFDRYSDVGQTGWLRHNYGSLLGSNETIEVCHAVYTLPEKIVVRQTSDTLIATIDTSRKYCGRSVIVITREGSLSLGYLLALFNSRLLAWIYDLLVQEESRVLAQVKVNKIKRLPIRRISFTTPAERRAALVDQAKRLYDAYLDSGNPAPVLDFVSARLAAQPEESDVVHDLLAHLAEQMIEMNKQKQAEMKGFLAWLEREIGARVDDLTGKSKIRGYLGDYQKGEDPLALQELLDILKRNARRLKADPSARAFQEALAREYEASLNKLLPVKARLAATDRLIDLVVYRLYGLTDEEIAIVEGRAT